MKKEDLIEEVTEQAPQEDIAEYLPTPAEDFSHTLEETKNTDVFNALNMFNEDLGALYETQGYNPFEEDFVLTEDYAFDILDHKANPNEISKEEFLEKGNEEIAKHFHKALNANKALLAKTEKELATVTDPNVKEQLQKMIVTLKNRNELLKLNINKLKQKDANALKMYMEMFGMDAELSDLLKEEFTEKVNKNIVIQRMIELCNTRSNQKQQRKLTKQQQQALNKAMQQQQQLDKSNTTEKNAQWYNLNQENTGNNNFTFGRDRDGNGIPDWMEGRGPGKGIGPHPGPHHGPHDHPGPHHGPHDHHGPHHGPHDHHGPHHGPHDHHGPHPGPHHEPRNANPPHEPIPRDNQPSHSPSIPTTNHSARNAADFANNFDKMEKEGAFNSLPDDPGVAKNGTRIERYDLGKDL